MRDLEVIAAKDVGSLDSILERGAVAKPDEADDLREQIAKLKDRIDALNLTVTGLRVDKADLKAQVDILQERVAKLKDRNGELRGYLMTAVARLPKDDQQLLDDLNAIVYKDREWK